MKLITVILVTMFFISETNAQSFAINTDGTAANSSALLDVKSTNKGVLVPRMSKAEKNAIAAPATGLLVFQHAPDSTGFYFYNGSSWSWLSVATTVNGWATTGNAGTDTAVNFIGTLDNEPIRFKQNDQWIGQWNRSTSNFFTGNNSGINNTSGIGSTAMGSFTLAANTTGSFNHAFGSGALSSNITGSQNIAIGNSTLASHKANDNNTALALWPCGRIPADSTIRRLEPAPCSPTATEIIISQ